MKIKQICKLMFQVAKWQIIGRTIGKDNWFLCTRSIGDTTLFLSKLYEYKRINPEKHINIIISENHVPLLSGYSDVIDQVRVHSYKEMCNLVIIGSKQLFPQNIHYILPASSVSMLGYNGMSISDLMNISLMLPPQTGCTAPKFTWSDKEKKAFFKDKGLKKGEYVFLCMSAVTVNFENMKIWSDLIKIIKEKGYKVVINNSKIEDSTVKNEIHISLSIDKTYLFAEDAVLFVGIRNGLCDLIAFSSCKMVVIYPDKDEKAKNMYTFVNMPFEKRIIECFENDVLNVIRDELNPFSNINKYTK